MKYFYLLIFIFFTITNYSQTVEDSFEGNGTITSWFGDNCDLDTNLINPYQESINTSNTVLEYHDTGGQYANVRFDASPNFNLTTNNSFSLKIYVPSNGLTGTQPNQVSLKLQNGTLAEPWMSQSEIIKPLLLNEWQEVTFNFETDTFINLDASSPPPIQRTDFNRVVIQINGENNNDHVLAYIDDVLYFNTDNSNPVFDDLVWSDEFDGSGAIDGSKWHHQTQLPAGGSWYNGEIQHYTNREANSSVSGGFLQLTAKKETFNDQGFTKQYTSARLNSKFAFTYGKVEIRAKLPSGVGTWPALWMLGKNINEDGGYWDIQGFGSTNWPACGEIDIMEHWGDNQNFVQSAMHTPSSFGNTMNKGGQTVTAASSEFHVYTLEWTEEKMVFKVDDVIHYTYNPDIKDANTWPFDAPQYLLFNIAILPNVASSFTESAMEVDYVRVYQQSTLSTSSLSDENAINYYPNPVTDVLHITLDKNHTELLLKIVDVSGRSIASKQTQVSNGTLRFKTQTLNQGLYFATLTFKNGASKSFKFIKK